MIQFVNNYEDLSTDKGYQFKFYCDKCGNGFMSRFQTSTLGVASSFLNAASSLLGWGHSAGHSAYEIQRAVGGKAHDSALEIAVRKANRIFINVPAAANGFARKFAGTRKQSMRGMRTRF
jgi:hypothetical protein